MRIRSVCTPWLVRAFIVVVSFVASIGDARAEEARPVARGSTTGYELALQGAPVGELGHDIELQGIAYEVAGLAELRATKGLELDAVVTARKQKGTGRETVTRGAAKAGAGGQFLIAVPVPSRALAAPRLELTVHRRGQPGRTLVLPISTRAPDRLDLLTDRQRYEPGETLRAWVRATTIRGGAPVNGCSLLVTLRDGSGRPVGDRTVRSSAAGVGIFEMELPETAEEGLWQVSATLVDGGMADPVSQEISVTRRTVERLQASIELDQELLRPGATLTGRVVVRTPSGSAVRGAQVQLYRDEGDPLVLQTDADGVARFRTEAPAFLSGDVSPAHLEARVVHPAHGTIRATASYTVARVRWMVEATPASGGVVPEVGSEVFIGVSDPRGRPIQAGTKVRVRSLGIRGGEAEVATDAHGLAMVTVELPRGAASRRRSGPCQGEVATTFEIEVLAEQPLTARLCVPVSTDALVLPRAERALLEPGAEVAVTIQRRPEVRDRPVLIEAIWSGRAVAWAWAGPREDRVTLDLPDQLTGVIRLRARPQWSSDRQRPLDQPGATSFGVGAETAILVRPRDAFSLDVSPERELFHVREEAPVTLRASQPPAQGWVALLVRDEAAQGGETRWALDWIGQELQEAMSDGDSPENDRFLRLSLAAVVSPDVDQVEPPPLVVQPWERSLGSYSASGAVATGVVRDPLARREELLRRGLAPAMRALEAVVATLGSQEQARQGVTRSAGGRRVTFDPDVIANLVSSHRLNDQNAQTLGGEPLTVAMITAADPSFTYDAVARRVARNRLVRLLSALSSFADPDNAAAVRASSNEPPERWLSALVQLGMVDAEALIDPWGRPFSFRPVTGRQPAVVVSERALRFELASPGPDGVIGTADDVRDPFARAVARNTPYAIASGEDALMTRLSRIAPGSRVLEAMVGAYDRLGLAAADELRRGPVEAASSEDMAPPTETPAPEALNGLGPGGSTATASRMLAAADAPAALAAEAERDRDGRIEIDQRLISGEEALREEAEGEPMEPTPEPTPQAIESRSQVMGEMVRERFPATLFFLGEARLDAQGAVTVDVPLADALTTYRLEAIAWTASGWATSAMSRIRVDQEAMIDAPVPPFATVGDHIRLPVRVANRTDAVLPVGVEIEAEGDLVLEHQEVTALEVPPHEAVEAIVDVRLGTVGSGSLLIRALHRGEGRTLDAVRRPLEVLDDVRLAREVREELIEAGQVVRVEIPDEARPRGPGSLRLAVGSGLFGEPVDWGQDGGTDSALWAGWALAVSGRDIPESLLGMILSWVPEEDDEWYRAPQDVARALAVLWRDDRLSDDTARAGLRVISPLLPTEDAVGAEPEDSGVDDEQLAWILLSMAPVFADADRRPALREDLTTIGDRLRRHLSSRAAQATEAPVTWALAAATLAVLDRSADNERALGMIRRATRHAIEVGDEAWLEPPTTNGTMLPRVEPTALLALARLALGDDRQAALALIRSLSRLERTVDRWPTRTRAVASAAAAMLTPNARSDGDVSVILDGRAVQVERDQGVVTAVLDGIGRPGAHRIEVSMPQGQVAMAWLELRYGLPWSVRPENEAPVDLEWTGPAGARDGRAGLRLEVRHRGARIMTRPVVEVELPAGTELDEPTREALDAVLAEPATVDGRTLRLPLRPLAPGGYVRIPMPLRWALSGTIIGLGTTLWDDAGPASLSARQEVVVPSRGVEIADRGEEPEQQDAEASPPRPPRLPPIQPLDPIAEVIR